MAKGDVLVTGYTFDERATDALKALVAENAKECKRRLPRADWERVSALIKQGVEQGKDLRWANECLCHEIEWLDSHDYFYMTEDLRHGG